MTGRPDLRVVVAGDVTEDWHLAAAPGPRDVLVAGASVERGGAARLAVLMSSVAGEFGRDGGPRIEVRGPASPAAPDPGDEGAHRSWSLWAPFEGHAWRIREVVGAASAPEPAGDGSADSGEADLVILVDAALGFRHRPERWPAALGSGSATVLLDTAAPLARGFLWDRLQEAAGRLIAVVRIEDLRRSEVTVSRELSWERTAQDLMWELLHNQRINGLARCAHVVVSLGTAGALLLSNGGADVPPACTLVFDPETMEGEWAERHPGAVAGSGSCLTAGIARQVLISPGRPDLAAGIHRGIGAMRALHLEGYRNRPDDAGRPRLSFPGERVARELAGDGTPFSQAVVRDPTSALAKAPGGDEPRAWTILEDRHPGGLEELGRRIVLEGAEEALHGVPLGRFGRLLTVDRHEIEGYRSIGVLIREYARRARPERPLSIAVFGPPGSGKSFGVKEVARSVLPDRIATLTFNLSQFEEPSGLLDAFHRVRDTSLAGMLPLVFWDEFDTAFRGEPLGWLRYFLSPMQDGEFQEDQVTHPIGPAVFVFAGGTSARLRDFGAVAPRFAEVKGPDFVSRLKGSVDVLGPDPGDDRDPYFLVRRAILLRSMLERGHPALFRGRALDIDPGVLRAFLLTDRYRHGARSLESILAMSTLSGRSRFERSCLPAQDQLDLHVDAPGFLDLVHRLDLEDPDLVERMAETAHVVFSAALLERGMTWGREDDDYLLRHPLLEPFAGHRRDPSRSHRTLVPWGDLPEEDREENRALVRDTPNKLAAAGFAMRPARSGQAPAELGKEAIELLAEQEHERWLRSKLAAGWSYGPDRDDGVRRHPAIVPWSAAPPGDLARRYGREWAARMGEQELPEPEKAKDRELVEGLARILAVCGYAVARVGGP